MTEENLLYRDPESISDLSPQERENLRVVMEELKGWDTQNVDRVPSIMAKDGLYHDITLPPAKGWEGIRKFGEGWVKAAPDFHVVVEKFVVQGENVVNMGRISGTIRGEYFGLPATSSIHGSGDHIQSHNGDLHAPWTGYVDSLGYCDENSRPA
jgi:hypothetical protein